MRKALAIVVFVAACGKSSEDAAEAARKEAEAENKQAAASAAAQPPTKVLRPPVPEGVHVPCEQMIDPAAFTTAIGEKDPLALRDDTKNNKDTTATCTLLKGGKRLSKQEQDQLLKKERRLGVMGGDDLCTVAAYCSLMEDEAHFEDRCKQLKLQDDNSTGGYACLQIVAQGADDVDSFKLFDADSRCVLWIHGGPSNVDNDVITKCAKAARDLIGPDNIKPPK